ncbi:tau 95 subunit of transcription factor TFIIIC [Spiromyces aspiralis]|uniref:Tau 95 subunit of transcription factor TFIIIC n=1 Tax=Spiromyces aspiralis TaxID=68401 RepID=A0ACC1HDH9_9FUNG|nr:tau 95 subunit of transcription factor TFIIIC [Spiromyces aspiralis]
MVAFWMSTGPWRDCWVRYGYDPRRDPAAAAYQSVDMRNIASVASQADGRPQRGSKGTKGSGPGILSQDTSRRPSDALPYSGTGDPTAIDREPPESPPHRFSGKYLQRPQYGVYQLCDIEIPSIRRLQDMPEGQRPTCCEQSGWFYQALLKTIRRIMRARMRLIQDRLDQGWPIGTPISDADDNDEEAGLLNFDSLRRTIEEEKDELAAREREQERLAYRAQDSSSIPSDELQKKISSRVDMLMKQQLLLQIQGGDREGGKPEAEPEAEEEDESGAQLLATMDNYDEADNDFGNIFGDDEDEAD